MVDVGEAMAIFHQWERLQEHDSIQLGLVLGHSQVEAASVVLQIAETSMVNRTTMSSCHREQCVSSPHIPPHILHINRISILFTERYVHVMTQMTVIFECIFYCSYTFGTKKATLGSQCAYKSAQPY
jgi:hypothetical protein